MTADRRGEPDYLAAYSAVLARIEHVIGRDDGDAPVPACPGWRVRDVVAHLAGLCDDWVCQRLDGYASGRWTADQVARYAQRSCTEILQKWAGTMEDFAALGDDLIMGRPPARWAFGDAVIHEADIRGALARGRVPHDAVLMALEGSIQRWREVLHTAGMPTLHVRSPNAPDWWLGTEDDPDPVVCESDTYELFRALAGRRDVEQVRTWAWSEDPSPFIDAGLPFPFHFAAAPICD